MQYNNAKSPIKVNKPRTPAKPASLNSSAKESSASLKFNSPAIRVGLSDNKFPKMPKDKNVAVRPKVKATSPKATKAKIAKK